jgi:hypothetical protein
MSQIAVLILLFSGLFVVPVASVEFDVWLKRNISIYRRFRLVSPETGLISALLVLAFPLPFAEFLRQQPMPHLGIFLLGGSALVWLGYLKRRTRAWRS